MSDFLEKAADTFTLPADVVAGLPRIEITGCRDILIHDHRGLLKYSEEETDINCGSAILRVRGQNLNIIAMTRSEIRLKGALSAVEFIL